MAIGEAAMSKREKVMAAFVMSAVGVIVLSCVAGWISLVIS